MKYESYESSEAMDIVELIDKRSVDLIEMTARLRRAKEVTSAYA